MLVSNVYNSKTNKLLGVIKSQPYFTTVHFLDERAQKREQRQIPLGIDEIFVIF